MALLSSIAVPNQGSTCRDQLAWERNLLSYIKLSLLLFVLGTVLSVQFQLTSPSDTHSAPQTKWAEPLGIVFQVVSLITMCSGLFSFFENQRQGLQNKGFVQTSRSVRVVVVLVCLLCVGTCIALLVTEL